MRAALGVLFLVLLFVAATLVQDRWIDDVRKRLPGLRIQPEHETLAQANERQSETGWARVVVGRPSGAEPIIPRAEYRQRDAVELERMMIEGGDFEPPAPIEEPVYRPSDFEITLDASSTLSEVCVKFYGSGAPKLYERLATYNNLPNANAIRAGQKLFVPPTRELLLAE